MEAGTPQPEFNAPENRANLANSLSARAGPQQGSGCYLAIVTAVVLLYNLFFFNRYLPITEGWFSVYAAQINGGHMPYRDFYLLLPPAYPLLLSAFTAVFGYGFFALRVAGVLLICVFSGALFGILRFCFAGWVAAAVAIAMTVYYQTGVAHITYDFVQVLTTCVLLSTYCLLRFARTELTGRLVSFKNLRWALTAGLFCGWAGMTKQSNGSVVTVFCALAAVVAGAQESWKKAALGLLGFSAGAAGVVLAFVIWLAAIGAWHDFVGQVVFGALGAKGSLGTILFAFMGHFFGYVLWAQVKYLAPYFAVSAVWGLLLFRYGDRLWAQDSGRTNRWLPPVVLGFSLLAIGLPRWWPERVAGLAPAGWESMRNYLIPCGVIGPLLIGGAILLTAVVKWKRPHLLLVPILVALGLVWGNGTSAGLSETGVFLGLAIFLAVLLSHAGWFTPVTLAAAGLMWLQTATWAETKYDHPYAWWGLKESGIREALVPAPHPLQRGMWVGPETAEIYRRMVAIIERETKPGDRILVFPHTPAFYLLCQRPIMGRAIVHWFDFLPDDLARREAEVLQKNPPALVVWLEMPEVVWEAHERLFRAGQPCGQRVIRQVYDDMQASGRLREIEQVRVSDGFVFHLSRLQP